MLHAGHDDHLNGQRARPHPRRVAYITSPEAREAADRLPSNTGRSSLVHALIECMDLLEQEDQDEDHGYGSNFAHDLSLDQDDSLRDYTTSMNRARIVHPIPATRADICKFHDKAMVSALFDTATTQADPRASPTSNVTGQYPLSLCDHDVSASLEFDCPPFPGLEDYCSYVAGGSITAARQIRQGKADVAIYWDGGRHHATKSAPAGFCYVNDVVLAILELQRSPALDPPSAKTGTGPSKRLKKIMYIDLDLHHGDGVAEAFETNPNVLTISLHLWSRGFYPSTHTTALKGMLVYTGPSSPPAARNKTLNLAVPKSGLSDSNLLRLVESCIKPLFAAFEPDALVMQCGVDTLAGDPCKEFNISSAGYQKCVETILSWCVQTDAIFARPVLLLGGGGYHATNAARMWTRLTAVALGRSASSIPESILESCTMWDTFYMDGAGGDTLHVQSHQSRKDENSEDDLLRIEEHFGRIAASLSQMV